MGRCGQVVDPKKLPAIDSYTTIRKAHRRRIFGERVLIFWYGARFVGGQWNPDYNGVAIVNETRNVLVADSIERYKASEGYNARAWGKQISIFNWLSTTATQAEFVHYAQQLPQYCDGSLKSK